MIQPVVNLLIVRLSALRDMAIVAMASASVGGAIPERHVNEISMSAPRVDMIVNKYVSIQTDLTNAHAIQAIIPTPQIPIAVS